MFSTSTINAIDLNVMLKSDATKRGAQVAIASTSSNGNYVYMDVYDSNDSLQTYLRLLSTGQSTLRTNGDFHIISAGAVQITSSSSQDIRIISADDLYLTATDKIYINGNHMSFKTFTVSGTSYTALCIA